MEVKPTDQGEQVRNEQIRGEQVRGELVRLTPFYFGPAEKQLFGVYYAPPPGQESEFGVLLCNPWGQEYVRAHRAQAQLALRLARQGLPVLRFDYFACGDSLGADEEGTLAQWQADVRAALQELKRRGRVEEVFVVGLRLGASLGTLVASGREDVAGLVLWEPVVNGPAYLAELRAWHEEKQFYFLSEGREEAVQAPGLSAAPGENVRGEQFPTELLGFKLHANLCAELQTLDLLNLKRKPARRMLVIESQAQPAVEQFRQQVERLGAQVDYALIESFKMWTEDPDKGLVPQPILQAAIHWLTQEAG